MDLREEADKWVSDLATKVGIKDEVKFDDEDTCVIFLDEKILFILELNEDIHGIVINVVIGNLPEKDREAVLYDMMSANFFWNRTEGATLGVDEETDIVGLCYMVSLPLENEDDFDVVFEKLANVGEYWIDRLKLEKPSGEIAEESHKGYLRA